MVTTKDVDDKDLSVDEAAVRNAAVSAIRHAGIERVALVAAENDRRLRDAKAEAKREDERAETIAGRRSAELRASLTESVRGDLTALAASFGPSPRAATEGLIAAFRKHDEAARRTLGVALGAHFVGLAFVEAAPDFDVRYGSSDQFWKHTHCAGAYAVGGDILTRSEFAREAILGNAGVRRVEALIADVELAVANAITSTRSFTSPPPDGGAGRFECFQTAIDESALFGALLAHDRATQNARVAARADARVNADAEQRRRRDYRVVP